MRFLDIDPSVFHDRYNRLPFLLKHRLTEHPQLQIPALRALALRLPRRAVLHRHAVVPIDADFERAHKEHSLALTLEETFDRLEEVKGYIVLNTPETDHAFRPLVNEVLGEIRGFSDPLDPGFYWSATYVFVSAGGSVTPYHMDREMNFLLQIRGTKAVSLWDPADRSVMTEEERERLFTDYAAPRPPWRDSHREKEMRFEIGPGEGVHHPFIAPHLVVNREAPSVSWALTFRTRGSDIKGDVHRVNHLLRRTGVTPMPEGRSSLRDSVKSIGFRLARQVATRVRPRGSKTSNQEP